MKSIVPFILILLISISAVLAQTTGKKNDPVGKWKFEAPYAPVEFASGIIEVTFAENKYSTTISFTGSDYKIPGENNRFEKETYLFSVYIEGEYVSISLKMENGNKMSGKAVYSEGEIPVALTREEIKK